MIINEQGSEERMSEMCRARQTYPKSLNDGNVSE